MNAAAIRDASSRLAKLIEEAASMLEASPFEMAAQVERERIMKVIILRHQQLPKAEAARRHELEQLISVLHLGR